MKSQNIVGLIPAAGQATRLSPLPFSKELFPLGFRSIKGHNLRPKVISQYLLENFQSADITKIYMILRQGKWDIANYYGDGFEWGLDIAYLMMRLPYGVPYTLDAAYAFIKDAYVAVGFPDIIYKPGDAFKPLRAKLEEGKDDVVLGVFPTQTPQTSDMVDLDQEGYVRKLEIKPKDSSLRLSWGLAVWSPRFTDFMHQYLQTVGQEKPKELFLGNVIQAAIDQGFAVQSVVFPEGAFLDIGHIEGLEKALNQFGVI